MGAALQGAIIANQGIIPGAEQRELVLLDGKPLCCSLLLFPVADNSHILCLVLPMSNRFPDCILFLLLSLFSFVFPTHVFLIFLIVTPLNLGIEVQSGELSVIIPAQTPIPCKKTHVLLLPLPSFGFL